MDWDRFSYVRNNPINYTDPTGYDVDCTSGEGGCRRRVWVEQAESLLSKLANKEEPVTWNNLSKKEQNTLNNVGWDQTTYDHSDYVMPSVKDIARTGEDPVVYISLALGWPAASGGKFLLTQAAYACFRNPVCGTVVFGFPTTYASRLDKQTDEFHNFPRLLDSTIISEGDRVVKNFNYVEYQLKGEIALAIGSKGYKLYQGVYQIGVELKNFVPVITHHFFDQ